MGRGRRSRRAERLRSEDGIDGLPHSWPGPDLSDDAPLDARVRDVLGTTPSDDDDEPPLARALEEEPAAAGARSGVPGGPGPEPARRHAEPEHRPHCPDLPAECVSLILAQLSDALDLVACQQLGRTWRQCATEEALWHKLCVETWPISCYKPQPADPASARTSWRKQYARMLTQRALTWGQMLNGVRSAPTALALPLPLTHAHAHARALGRGAWLARTAARSIREVAFGKRHVAILTFSGEVWTMGAGEDGALGHGDTLPVSTPRRVELLVGRTLSAVACGVAHTATLTAEHEAVLWGLNSSGQLGTGDTVLCAVPYSAPAVASLPPIGSIACGGTHTLLAALFSSDVWVLGDDQMSSSSVATPHPPGIELMPRLLALPPGASDTPAKAVVANDGVSAIVTREGRLYTWGADNAFGRLGHGDRDEAEAREPTEVRALRGRWVVCAAASSSHMSAVTADGAVWTWGKGTVGQLGHGHKANSATPQLVGALHGRQMAQVACGETFTAALSARGDVFAWGSNQEGQLGGGGGGRRNVPRLVKALCARGSALTKLTAGGHAAAAIVHWVPTPSRPSPPPAAAAAAPSPPPPPLQAAGSPLVAHSAPGRVGRARPSSGSGGRRASRAPTTPALVVRGFDLGAAEAPGARDSQAGAGGGSGAEALAAAGGVQALLDRFAADASLSRLALPPSLSSHQRQQLHVLAGRAGLHHKSVGSGAARRLVLSKPPFAHDDECGSDHEAAAESAAPAAGMGRRC